MNRKTVGSFCVVCLGLVPFSLAPARAMPAQDTGKNHCDMTERGNMAMGFDAASTTHHFRVNGSGGTIEVTANDPADAESQAAIQGHLQHIAKMFQEGDFDIPALVHNRIPPGVPTMKRLKTEIAYRYIATEQGGGVELSSQDAEAVSAIHDFLDFQIKEHQTGDKP